MLEESSEGVTHLYGKQFFPEFISVGFICAARGGMRVRIGKKGMMIGQFVTSKAGHDKGTLYVVSNLEEEFVYLCDGRLKLLASPKKKRMKHVQPINEAVDAVLQKRLIDGEKVYDEEVRYAIKQYKINHK